MSKKGQFPRAPRLWLFLQSSSGVGFSQRTFLRSGTLEACLSDDEVRLAHPEPYLRQVYPFQPQSQDPKKEPDRGGRSGRRRNTAGLKTSKDRWMGEGFSVCFESVGVFGSQS